MEDPTSGDGRRSTTPSPRRSASPPTLHHQTSALDGFVLLIGIQIGSGIFTSPAQIDLNVPSPAAALLAWTIAGLIAWAGATSFAELGATLPQAGGMQEYLRYVYGDMVAFSMSWVWLFVEKPVSMAILSILMVESVSQGLGTNDSEVLKKVVSCLGLLMMAVINCYDTRPAGQLGRGFVVLKFFTVGLIMLGALIVFTMHFTNPSLPSNSSDWYKRNWFAPRSNGIEWQDMEWWPILGHFAAATTGGFWSYGGWENANFLAAEMKDPHRNLPRAIHSAMACVVACFLTCNISYFILLPWGEIGLNDAIAVAAAKTLLGRPGQLLFGILIALSCAGCLGGNILVVGRLAMAASHKKYMPEMLGRPVKLPTLQFGSTTLSTLPEFEELTHSDVEHHEAKAVESHPAIYAIALSSCISLFWVCTGSYQTLVTFVGVAQYTFFFLAVLSLIILRFREPDLLRPYKASIFIPIAFCTFAAVVILRTVTFLPGQGLMFVSLLSSGIVYRLWSTQHSR